MLEKSFVEVYDKFKLQFYRKVFELVRERDGSLSAMEGFYPFQFPHYPAKGLNFRFGISWRFYD